MFRSVRCATLGLILALALTAGTQAADNTTFNYQGRMLVNGLPFSGAATLKLAIVNTTGTITLWSNDGSSTSGSQPTAALPVQAVNGVFDVMVGDTALGMQPIKSIMFNGRNDLRLRVWLNDGTHGYQQLSPDRPIPSGYPLGLQRVTEALTLYVNSNTGNDAFNGLASSQPKKTIQSAVNMLPAQVDENVTINIANGVYREQIGIHGITVKFAKQVTLLGDQDWTPASVGNPNVRITGTDDDVVRVRTFGIVAEQCSGFTFQGLLLDRCESGCKLFSCSTTFLKNVASINNDLAGLYVIGGNVGIQAGRFNYNVGGMSEDQGAVVQLQGACEFSHNTHIGIECSENSEAYFRGSDPGVLHYAGQIQFNGQYGLYMNFQSYSMGHTFNAFSNNSVGDIFTGNGSALY